jgi:hypothetical protein
MKALFLFIILFSFSSLYSQEKDTIFVVGNDSCACKYYYGKEDDESEIFDKSEKVASFPGGEKAWEKYIIDNTSGEAENHRQLLVFRFIVDKNGNISKIIAENNISEKKFNKAKQLIFNSGKWFPAMQNGHCVTAFAEIGIKF